MDELSLFVRLILAFLFFSTSWSKQRAMDEHISIVKDYQILPERWIEPFARAEVYLELCLSAFLLTGLFQQAAAVMSACLLLVFTTAVLVNLIRGRTEISCGCGGAAGNHQLSWWLVLRNACLISMTGLVYLTNSSLGSADAWMAGKSAEAMFNWRVWFLLCGAGMTMLVRISWQQMQEIAQEMRTFWERV